MIVSVVQLRDGQFKEGEFQGRGEVDTKATYAEEERRNQELEAAAGKQHKGGLLSRFMPMLPGRKKAATPTAAAADNGEGSAGSVQRLRQEDLEREQAAAMAAKALEDGKVFFELKNILRSRSLDNIVSKALSSVDDEVYLFLLNIMQQISLEQLRKNECFWNVVYLKTLKLLWFVQIVQYVLRLQMRWSKDTASPNLLAQWHCRSRPSSRRLVLPVSDRRANALTPQNASTFISGLMIDVSQRIIKYVPNLQKFKKAWKH